MESHQKGFLKLKCFSPLRILTSLLFEETLRVFLFSSFFHAPSLEDSGILMIFEEKSLLQKLIFKWIRYTGGGHIFWNGVMHTNLAKP
jgi:hypothetical protein